MCGFVSCAKLSPGSTQPEELQLPHAPTYTVLSDHSCTGKMEEDNRCRIMPDWFPKLSCYYMTGGFILGVSQLEDVCDRFIVVDKSFFECMKKEEYISEIIQALFCEMRMLCYAVTPRTVCVCTEALTCLVSLMVHRSLVNWDWEKEVVTCQCTAWLLPSQC